MNYSFELVKLEGKPLLWGHRCRNESDFAGYYHWHQICEFLYVHEGQGNIIVDQKTYPIRRGMLFVFQPFQLHKVYANVSADSPYIRTICHFDPVFVEAGLRPFPLRHQLFMQLWQGRAVELACDLLPWTNHMDRIFALYDHADSRGRGEEEEEISMLFLQLLNNLSDVSQVAANKQVEGLQTRPLRYSERVMHWLEEHYAEEISLASVADELHLSKFHLSRIFRSETGSSISDYLAVRRIKIACRLLQTTTLSIERIGIEVGVPNASYFIRMFKKIVGTTPLKYRNQLDV